MRLTAAVSAIVLAGLLGTAASAAEQVDNPLYANWSKHKVGTTVTYKQTTFIMGMVMEGPITYKLIEVKPGSVTIEITSKQSMNGQARPAITTKQEIPAKIDKDTESMPGFNASNEIKNVKEGKDTMEVKGANVETQTREFDITVKPDARAGITEEMMVHVRTWVSAQVPGGLVKAEQIATRKDTGEIKTTNMLTDYTLAQ